MKIYANRSKPTILESLQKFAGKPVWVQIISYDNYWYAQIISVYSVGYRKFVRYHEIDKGSVDAAKYHHYDEREIRNVLQATYDEELEDFEEHTVFVSPYEIMSDEEMNTVLRTFEREWDPDDEV